MNKRIGVGLSMLFLVLSLATVYGYGQMSDLRLQPSSTATDDTYYYLNVDNLTTYYDYIDGFLQDWTGALFLDGIQNVTIPNSTYRWTFDYDNYTSVIDQSLGGNNVDGARTNMFDGGLVRYYSFEDTELPFTYDWADAGRYDENASEHDRGGWDASPFYAWDNDWESEAHSVSLANLSENYTYFGEGGTWIVRTGTTTSYNYTDRTYSVNSSFIYDNKFVTKITSVVIGKYAAYARDSSGNWQTLDWEDCGLDYCNEIYEDAIRWETPGDPANATNATRALGYVGMGYDFNGIDNRIVLEDEPGTRLTTGGTIAAWIKPLTLGEGNTGRIIDRSSTSIATHGYYFTLANPNRLAFMVEADTTTKTFSNNNVITMDEWQHVAVVFNSTGRIIYVNGVDVTAVGGGETGLPPDIPNRTTIGNSDGLIRTFNGTIDEVYIYNSSLSLMQIHKLANHSCHTGYCYDFDGTNDQISITSQTYDLGSGGTTFSLWAKRSGGATDPNRQILLGNTTKSAFNFLSLFETNTELVLESETNGDACVGTLNDYDTEWHHYVVTVDNHICTLYQDGVNITKSSNSDINSNITLNAIGRSLDDTFNGTIDDVLIFDYALSPTEVNTTYRGLYTDNIWIGEYHSDVTWWNGTVSVNNVSSVTNVSAGTINITLLDGDGISLNGVNVSMAFNSDDNYYVFWSDQGNRTFYDILDGVYEIVFSALGYASRTYVSTVADYPTTYFTVYLINSSSTVVFTVKDEYNGDTIHDAVGTMQRSILGNYTTVESKETDITGRIRFSYAEDENYRFIFNKDGYESLIFYLNPIIFSEYDIFMTPTTVVNGTDDYAGISLVYGPTEFYNDENHAFSFVISSPAGELQEYGYTLTYSSGSSTESGNNALGGTLTSDFVISGATVYDTVQFDYYYRTVASGFKNFTLFYDISVIGTNNTFMGIRDRTFGLGLFERHLIAVLGAFFIAGVAVLLGRPLPGLVLGLFWLGIMAYIEFIPLWSVLISIAVGLVFIGSQTEV